MSTTYICPWCNHSSVVSGNRSRDAFKFFDNNKHGIMHLTSVATTCLNNACREFSLRSTLYKVVPQGRGLDDKFVQFAEWQLIPSSAAKPMPDYVPSNIIEDYREACAISSLSPKASATLARRCLQGMIRDFWKISGRTLNDEINGLQDKVDSATFDAINAIRQVGNIGAHMERDINVVVDVDPEEAMLLISMIEMLIKDWYVNRYDREQRVNKLLTMSAEKQEARKPKPSEDSASLPPPDTAG
ncbi:DUF4145 domain-containing protein [Xanthomonas arboricola pv. corylina]|uniref:DUF4145 domain-containing protein n=1 Tax=Xanthomonas arboricola TaxID=56448 RepID=UPI0040407283